MPGLAELRRDSFPPEHIVALSASGGGAGGSRGGRAIGGGDGGGDASGDKRSTVGAYTWAECLADMDSLREKIAAHGIAAPGAAEPEVAESGRAPCALFERDAGRFAAALLALLAEGRTVYLPGENHPAIIESLREEAALFIGDFPGQESIAAAPGPAQGQRDAREFALSGNIRIFTSGSTGAPKAIPKRLAQLDAETAALERCFCAALGDACILGTVSHQHFYGFMFSVLWPLCSGRPFWRATFIDSLQLAKCAAALDASCWIMSPVHLHRLSAAMPWHDLRGSLRAVFSAGGPLSLAAAREVAAGIGFCPWEIYGSSETGVVACRQQSPTAQPAANTASGAGAANAEAEAEAATADAGIDSATEAEAETAARAANAGADSAAEEEAPWAAMPPVEIAPGENGSLKARSPFLPDGEWYETQDQARFNEDGRFHLGGRLDRIVKLEGKRVSLPEIEAALNAHDWISDAFAAAVQRQRRAAAALIALAAAGEAALLEQGQAQFTRALRQFLARRLPAAAIPRVWRIAARLPRNAQSKIRREQAMVLLETRHLPAVLGEETEAGRAKLRLRVDRSCPYFQGHFPQGAVLPGVAQIRWAEFFGSYYFGAAGGGLGSAETGAAGVGPGSSSAGGVGSGGTGAADGAAGVGSTGAGAGLGRFCGMKTVKFKEIIQPDAVLELDLEWEMEPRRLKFRFSSCHQGSQSSTGHPPRQAVEHSEGCLLYEAEG